MCLKRQPPELLYKNVFLKIFHFTLFYKNTIIFDMPQFYYFLRFDPKYILKIFAF